ncbi:MAG: sulfotransferase [Planctomycetota bacterium]
MTTEQPLPDFVARTRLAIDEVSQRRVFFVVGCQKSGTTWVQKLLNAHRQVSCRGESHLCDVLAPLLQQACRQYNAPGKCNHKLDEDDLLAMLRTVMDRRLLAGIERPQRGADARGEHVVAVGDKTPEAALAIPLLDRLYPGARFIHVIRDGRDGAASGWAHLERQNETGQFASFAAYAGYFAQHHWKPYITAARTAGESLGERYIEVRYESLLEAPAEQARRLFDALGADSSPGAIEPAVAAASFKKQSGGRAAGDEDRASHMRKGIVGDWRNTFDAEAERTFDQHAGDLLQQLGYAEPAAV